MEVLLQAVDGNKPDNSQQSGSESANLLCISRPNLANKIVLNRITRNFHRKLPALKTHISSYKGGRLAKFDLAHRKGQICRLPPTFTTGRVRRNNKIHVHEA